MPTAIVDCQEILELRVQKEHAEAKESRGRRVNVESKGRLAVKVSKAEWELLGNQAAMERQDLRAIRVTQVLWVKAGPTGSEVYRVLLELRVSEDVRDHEDLRVNQADRDPLDLLANAVCLATLLHQWCVFPELDHQKDLEAALVMGLNQALKKKVKVDLTENEDQLQAWKCKFSIALLNSARRCTNWNTATTQDSSPLKPAVIFSFATPFTAWRTVIMTSILMLDPLKTRSEYTATSPTKPPASGLK